MGREFVLAPSPLEVNSLPVSYVVPELPWDIDVVLDVATQHALADASRAIGRLEGAYRTAVPMPHQLQCALATLEGWACVSASSGQPRWVDITRAFTDDRHRYGRGKTGAELAARLIGFHSGLDKHMGRRGASAGIVDNELDDGEFVSPRFRDAYEYGINEWLTDGPGSGLLRSALSMMSMAASMPESSRVAMAARSIFPWMLIQTRAADAFVPISLGFIERDAEWDEVARALAGSSGDEQATVNRGLTLVLRAVERATILAAYEVEGLQYQARRLPQGEQDWLRAARPSVREVFYLVSALPCATRQHLQALTGMTARTINSAVRELESRDLVNVAGAVRAKFDYVVHSKPKRVPWMGAVHHYPGVSEASDGQR